MLYGSQFSLTSIAFTVTPMLGCINWLHCIPQVPFIGCSAILYSIIRVMQSSSSINHILVLVCMAVAIVHIRMTVCQTRWIVGCRRCCWEIRNSCSIFWWFCKSIIILVYKQLYIDHHNVSGKNLKKHVWILIMTTLKLTTILNNASLLFDCP